jgi:hypothetical protein
VFAPSAPVDVAVEKRPIAVTSAPGSGTIARTNTL